MQDYCMIRVFGKESSLTIQRMMCYKPIYAFRTAWPRPPPKDVRYGGRAQRPSDAGL